MTNHIKLWDAKRWQTTLNCEMPKGDKPHWIVRCQKVTNHIELRNAKVTLYSNETGPGNQGFRPITPCLIIEILAEWVKSLKPLPYYTVTNFTFAQQLFLVGSISKLKSISYWIRLHSCGFQITLAQHVSAPTTTILTTQWVPTTTWTALVT